MDSTEQLQSCPSPYPQTSSSFLKDISNFKTPKRPSHLHKFTSPSTQPFFTASKFTPHSVSSIRRPSFSGQTKPKLTATARRLKAFQLEQSQSSRKAQMKKEQSLKSLSKSLSTWLNFLFQNPEGCGCRLTVSRNQRNSGPTGLGKRRESGGGDGATWRSPKRQRDVTWRGGEKDGDDMESCKEFGKLRSSLKDVCSFDDLKQRMRAYLSLASGKEIFYAMNHVIKNIDEGRLKMKAHCPIVTDRGMKEHAVRILMCYNPIWLRIGLHIIFGGDSLLPNSDVNSEQEIAFLKMVIEKQFFSHAGMAKAYAYNKKVEGLYRPGYYENLGSVILKRFLLLVLVLDRAKSHSSLSLKYGIDGVDGGSPLLFMVQSNIKSSRQMINDFLSSEVMLGEGNLLAHLVILGYKVSYEQSPLVEYDFRVTDLFVDVQDGVRLCRAIQLLQNDPSILMKIILQLDARKKKLANCGVALQYLKHGGVTLHDEEGMPITEDDVVDGDKELTISLLWNMFVHLQVPLLIDKTLLIEEISKIHGSDVISLKNINPSSSHLELLLHWIQAVCEKYGHRVDKFSSLVDGKAIWCLLDYYFRQELFCSDRLKQDTHESRSKTSIMSATDYTDAVHNFILSQKLTTILGNFPEVMQISDILEHSGAINDQTVVVLLVFLSSQLIVKNTVGQLNFHKLLGCICQSPERRHASAERYFVSSKGLLDQKEVDRHNNEEAARKFMAIKAWWQEMAERNHKLVAKTAASALQCSSTSKPITDIQRESAAIVIQSYFRRSVKQQNFLKMMDAVSFLQTVIRAWLLMKRKSFYKLSAIMVEELTSGRLKQSEKIGRHVKFIVDRYRFLKLRGSVLLIQRAVRSWMLRSLHTAARVNGTIVFQKYVRGWTARSRCEAAYMEKATDMCQNNGFSHFVIEPSITKLCSKNLMCSRSLHIQHLAATKIQSHFQAWILRRRFLNQKRAITKIQSDVRCLKHWRAFQQHRIATRSAIIIQSHVRGWIVRRKAERHKHLIGVLQRYCRGWLVRRDLLFQREAVTKIQSAIRCLNCLNAFHCRKHAATQIQRLVRGQITRNRILGSSHFFRACANYSNFQTSKTCFQSFELRVLLYSVSKLQRWWRGVLWLKLRRKSAITIQSHVRGWLSRQKAFRKRQNLLLLELRTKSAIIIQSCVRGWFGKRKASRERQHIFLLRLRTKSAITIQAYVRGCLSRRRASREKQCVVMLQSYWKGHLARKEAGRQLLDLRLRVQKSAKNVDDSERIINRLILALSELSSMKSVRGILHTCAILDMATEHSQKCCEELVAAGAIDHLLKLIRSVSQSVPDLEVLKHALSVLRNLARYPHLIEVLIDTHGSVETILWELLRNKEEGYFIASEVLKRIYSSKRSVEAVHKLPPILRRLRSHVEELTRKVNFEKRKPRGAAVRENTERRLREAVELLQLMCNG